MVGTLDCALDPVVWDQDFAEVLRCVLGQDTFNRRDCAVVRTLASHQCGPGSILGPGVIRGLSLLLVLSLLQEFFSGFSNFPPSIKTNTSKLEFDGGISRATGLSVARLLSATLVR